MPRDLSVGAFILSAGVLTIWFALLFVGPGWAFDAAVAAVPIFIIVAGVAYLVVVYRHRLII